MTAHNYTCDICGGVVAIALRDPDNLSVYSSELTVLREYLVFFGRSVCRPCYDFILTKEPLAIRKEGLKIPVKVDGVVPS